ncbi:AraC family transcriptional regulator [Methylotenera sp.]|uniref:AraC family transcriptional regulator n=1 Tax=Methylotenera sp. TaxID=2051956 RepID=UPI002733E599|nr:AraC family transcriptional regulator [Methylotenera sp.]MDP3307075.1 AraC family transcriptional regulator [Methylotenera sp.]
MDALTDILKSLRLSGGVYFRCELSAPWGMDIGQTSVAEFHLVARGRCWLKVAGKESTICLEAGDVVVFPHGHAHVLLDAPESVALSMEAVIGSQKIENYGPVVYGGGGVPANILCGYFEFDRKIHSPLLDALPLFIHIKGADATELSWLQTTVNFICHETRASGHGTEAVVNRLVEVLFIQIMRAYITQSTMPLGVLSAIADAKVGLALNAMHQKPEYNWTLDELAQQAGMSRTAFSQRFHALAGQTPMYYLTMWRMQKAKNMLESGNMTMSSIAEQAGYQSEASFSKAFKKCMGVSPGACRRKVAKDLVIPD